VGNRLTQDTLAGSNTYLYDIANRLIEVDGVTLTWDDNGNLLSDGVSTYEYDYDMTIARSITPPSISMRTGGIRQARFNSQVQLWIRIRLASLKWI
jgi:hypothetical protein